MDTIASNNGYRWKIPYANLLTHRLSYAQSRYAIASKHKYFSDMDRDVPRTHAFSDQLFHRQLVHCRHYERHPQRHPKLHLHAHW